jgi:hypothetical protein
MFRQWMLHRFMRLPGVKNNYEHGLSLKTAAKLSKEWGPLITAAANYDWRPHYYGLIAATAWGASRRQEGLGHGCIFRGSNPKIRK